MQELTFEQVEEVSGGWRTFKGNLYQFLLENMVTTMGNGEMPHTSKDEYFAPYPGDGLPPK